jgi:glycosyltransferase involved in cell wall biosynthesis
VKFAFLSRILGYHGYGVQTHLAGLLQAILRLNTGHEIILLAGREPLPLAELGLQGARVEVAAPSLDLGHPLGRLAWDHLAVGLACRRLGVDAVYAPAHVRPLYLPCPAVVEVHDMMYHLFPEQWSRSDRLYFRAGVDWLTRRASRVSTPSECSRRDFLRLVPYPAERAAVVYHGTPPGFAPVAAEECAAVLQRWGLERPYILYAGSFHRRKNLAGLLEAFEQAAPGCEHELAVAGPQEPPDAALLERLQHGPWAGRVRLLGLAPRADLPALFSAAQVFVFPSLYEGFGLPVLEAMACGCPVITTNASSLPEVAGEAGVLVPPGDSRALAQALQRVLGEAALHQELKRRGMEQARRFTWEQAARQTIELLEQSVAAP